MVELPLQYSTYQYLKCLITAEHRVAAGSLPLQPVAVIHVFSPWFVSCIALHLDFFALSFCHAGACRCLGVMPRGSGAHLNAMPVFVGLSVRGRASPPKWH